MASLPLTYLKISLCFWDSWQCNSQHSEY